MSTCTFDQGLVDQTEACGGETDASDKAIQKAFVAFLRLYIETYASDLCHRFILLVIEYFFRGGSDVLAANAALGRRRGLEVMFYAYFVCVLHGFANQ